MPTPLRHFVCTGWYLAIGLAAVAFCGPAVADGPDNAPNKPNTAEALAKQRYESIMADEKRTVGFIDKTISHAGAERTYRVWVPLDYDANKTYPVILYLHDQSARGIYGKNVMKSGIPLYIQDHYGQFDWIVVVPQALPGEGWSKKQIALALKEFDRSCREYSIDPQRLYLCGHGEGAEAGMQLAAREPRRFAAAMFVNEYDKDMVGRFTHLPVWMWASRSDWSFHRFVTKLIEAGQIEVRYSEFDCSYAELFTLIYGNPDVLAWMYQHTLDMLGRQAPRGPLVNAPKWGNRPLTTWFRLDKQGRPFFAPPILPRSLFRVKGLLKSGRYALAIEQLQQLIDREQLKQEEASLAAQLIKELTAYRENLDKAVADYTKHRNYPSAIITLQALADQFKPQPQAQAAAEQLQEWKTDKKVQSEIEAGLLYDRGRQYESAHRYREAAQIYDAIIKKYPNTLGASRAKYQLDSIKAKGKL